MERKIREINIWNTKSYTEIKVYFVNESRYGQHVKSHAAGSSWEDSNLSTDELKTAKSLALKDGKWTNYRAPREETATAKSFKKDEEELDAEAQAQEHTMRVPTTFASTTDRES